MPDDQDEGDRAREERVKAKLLAWGFPEEQAAEYARVWDHEGEADLPEVGEVEATLVPGFPRTRKPPTAG
jgi:hypothetical protein